MKKNEHGFGSVGILVVLVMVGLIGSVGWLVYDHQNSSNNTNSPATAQKTNTNDPSQPNVKYLKIESEGVKVQLSEPILDAYVLKSEGGVAFGTVSLDKIPGCKVHDIDSGPGPYAVGVANLGFDKYAKGFRTDQSPEESAFKNSGYASRVGDNWYEIEVSNSAECKSSDASTQAKIQAAKDAFRLASKSIIKL